MTKHRGRGPVRRIVDLHGASRQSWYRMEATTAAPEVTSVYIYDEIGYWGVSAAQFVKDLLQVTSAKMDLHINSPGGEVYDGVAIYNALRTHQASVTTYVDGMAASTASFIAMAGDQVVVMPNAEMMIHDAWGVCMGNAADMRTLADDLDRISQNIASIYAARSGSTLDAAGWREEMLAEKWYSAQEAVDLGLADSIGSLDPAGAQDSIARPVLVVRAQAEAAADLAATVPVEPAKEEDEGDPDLDFASITGALKEALA